MVGGVYTAIITPFNNDGSIDEPALKRLIDFNIKNNVSGIVPCGTTGESPTLDHDEHDRVIELTIKQVNKRVPVIAGTGSNATAEAIRLTKHAEEAGADGCLLVNPYYNKPTQKGLYLHFKAIADAVDFPCIVYNIKGRTGVNVNTDTLMKLANDCKNIVAVKEASGDMNQIKDVLAQRPEGFSVLSGDDGITLEVIKNGGQGVISVAANIVPDRMSAMVKAALEGDMEEAEKLNAELAPLFEVEFIETNPIPIKAALAMKGMCKEVYRLPMCEMEPAHKAKLKQVLKDLKFL
ncbi:MAG TPA: 4-hydroxy-tetrahydrodipicolinate synthase [Candidatus Nanoarchaeia archaeon]|nr:4-hydroxy-tetrahydrodipicolinate synthase [Candidatus Nanoarchaeia archaeon]